MKVALVYDRVNRWGGAERVLLALQEIFPEAPLFTSVYSPQKALWAKNFKVIPSFLQKFPLAINNHEAYPLLMPMAFEGFNFNDYEVVISITSEAAKGIITRPETFHLCYCLTPTRYLWSGYNDYFQNKILKTVSSPLIKYLKSWDLVAAQRPDCYLAISNNVKQRIKKYYQKESKVIYPPVETEKFMVSKSSQTNEKYFLVVSRLVKYKRVDLAIESFNQSGLSLKIVGEGRQLNALRKKAKSNIEFLGQLTGDELLTYYQNCQAVIFPQEEDFGIVPLEAQACGKPVIAFKAGGAQETIIEGKTGLFFYPQTAESLTKKIKSFNSKDYRPEDCRRQAEKFNKERFKSEFKKFIAEKCQRT